MDKILYEFLEFEKEKNLFERQYKGVYYWQSIRIDIARLVLYRRTNETGVSLEEKKNKLNKLITMAKGCFFDIKNFFNLSKCDLLYFDQQSYRFIEEECVDSYFDYFELDRLYSIQRCYYLSQGKTDNFLKSGIGTSWAEIMQGGMYTLIQKFPMLLRDVEEDSFIIELFNEIHQRFNIEIDSDEVIKRVRDILISHRVYSKYYTHIIKKVKPMAIIVVCHYDYKLFPLYAVAQKLGIPVIELEHGLICNHDAYNYLDISAKGKELPNYLFTYGEFWNQYIKLPECMKAIAVGNPFLENRRNKYKDIKPDEKKIVFYSDEITGREQAQFAIDFYKTYKEEGYKIYFKLHPTEYLHLQENYSFLLEYPDINIVSQKADLYELLASAKHHVSVASTVLFESAIFDVKRYVMIKPGWIQYIQPIIDIGLAKGFRGIEEFNELLKESKIENTDKMELIWKTNARENGLRVFEEIINANRKEG